MKVMRYTTEHLEIDGEIIDRDSGYPSLELTMEPVGLALAPRNQSVRLRVKIGPKTTVVGQDGVDELYVWLGENGARQPETKVDYEHHRYAGDSSKGDTDDGAFCYWPKSATQQACGRPRRHECHLLG